MHWSRSTILPSRFTFTYRRSHATPLPVQPVPAYEAFARQRGGPLPSNLTLQLAKNKAATSVQACPLKLQLRFGVFKGTWTCPATFSSSEAFARQRRHNKPPLTLQPTNQAPKRKPMMPRCSCFSGSPEELRTERRRHPGP